MPETSGDHALEPAPFSSFGQLQRFTGPGRDDVHLALAFAVAEKARRRESGDQIGFPDDFFPLVSW